MANRLFIFLAIIITTHNASAQQCNCKQSFDWMVSTFEKNDAGFQYVIDKKGTEDYKKFTALFKEKVKGISALAECETVMGEWLHYFRQGHIGVFIKEPETNDNNPAVEEIRLRYKDWKKIDLTEKQLIAALEKRKDKNPVEGIWSSKDYRLGIIADEKPSTKYTAFIIKADSIYWMPGQVKAEFVLNDDKKTFSVDYFKKDHSKANTQARLMNQPGTLLSLYNTTWLREFPKSTLTKKEGLLFSFSNSELPFVEKLSDKTIYLRIPSFMLGEKKHIDSVLAEYNALITSTPNLIIDIRNGTGGGDISYSKIIPYLYTNPIRCEGVQLFATELNAKGFDYYATQTPEVDNTGYCNGVAAKMRANLGKWINTSEKTYEIDSLPEVLPYPQKVGIICNHNNASSDEQFLLAARQSKKVKIFGRPTRGTLDISNLHIVDFPDGKFVLAYCMSKSYRVPDYCIDGVGIQPDYFIDDAVDEQDWIEYTQTVLEQ